MVTDLPLSSVFAIVASAAGFMMSVFIWRLAPYKRVWLTAFVVSLSVSILHSAVLPLASQGFLADGVRWFTWINLLILPSLYLYAVEQRPKMSWTIRLHFLPAVAAALLLGFYPATPLSFIYWCQMGIAGVYLVVLLLRAQRRGATRHSQGRALRGESLGHLDHMIWAIALLWLCDLLVFPALRFVGLGTAKIQGLFNFCGVLCVFWLAWVLSSKGPTTLNPLPGKSYEKSGLDMDTAETLAKNLQQLVTDEALYLRSDLTLRELAEVVGTTPHIVSEVLSRVVGKNFYEFINCFRIEAAKTALDQTRKTVLEIAYEVGFNNKASFNQAFKKLTSQTPTAYRKRSKNR